MPTYKVTGADKETGQPVSVDLHLGNVQEASDFASRWGVKVASITSQSGHTYVPDGKGGFRHGDRVSEDAVGYRDTALMVFSFMIPLVGIIAGAIRLSRRDASGSKVLISAILGAVFYVVLLSVLDRLFGRHR